MTGQCRQTSIRTIQIDRVEPVSRFFSPASRSTPKVRAAIEVRPAVETDSILALTTHVHTGLWVSVVSNLICDAIDLTGSLRTVPIVEPEVVSSIGLVVSKRFPLQPAMAALMAEARRGFTYEPASQLDGQTGN